jgi:hypothetical protein
LHPSSWLREDGELVRRVPSHAVVEVLALAFGHDFDRDFRVALRDVLALIVLLVRVGEHQPEPVRRIVFLLLPSNQLAEHHLLLSLEGPK